LRSITGSEILTEKMTRQATTSAGTATKRAPHAGALIETRDLCKKYGSGETEINVLDGISVGVEAGKLIAIVGPSGAGKSTFLHLLAALDTPTSGTVYFEGKAIHSFREAELADYRNRSIGFVWQRHHLLADFTAAENVAMPLLMRGARYGDALETSERWLREVGLGARVRQRAGELSGGEQQRVAIARALVQQPALLLADEPTGDLDERNAVGIFELMQRLHREHQLTSILATHNTILAGRADSVLQLERGKLQPVET
jgi:lipoprotein-releasing system ATP-binding protein